MNPRPSRVTPERCVGLPNAADWLAYLERSHAERRRDLRTLVAELRALGRTAAAVPPGSSFTESIPLRQPPEWYRSPAAAEIADIIVSFQAPSGGWSKNLDFSSHPRAPGEHFSLNPFDLGTCLERNGGLDSKAWHFVGTFDNNATTAQIRFLDQLVPALGAAAPGRWAAAARRGVEYVLAAQYPNGGWPQVWPLEGGYHDALAYNDGAIANNLALLLDLADGAVGSSWVPPPLLESCRLALERGLDGVVRTQLQAAGIRSGWCQQHDPITLEPSPGRSYEMAALASSESAGVVDVLMRLARPSPEVVAAIESAVSWLNAVAMPGRAPGDSSGGAKFFPPSDGKPIWARFYGVDDFKPLFGDRDRRIHQDLSKVSPERRGGYLWFSRAPRATLKAHAKWRLRQKLA